MIILLYIRWSLRYVLNYRDLEEIVAERGLKGNHTTTYWWVQRLHARVGEALPTTSQRGNQLVARRRNVL